MAKTKKAFRLGVAAGKWLGDANQMVLKVRDNAGGTSALTKYAQNIVRRDLRPKNSVRFRHGEARKPS